MQNHYTIIGCNVCIYSFFMDARLCWHFFFACFNYLYMKLQVLIHGVDVVKYILNYSGNNSHSIWIMQLPLKIKIIKWHQHISKSPDLCGSKWQKIYLHSVGLSGGCLPISKYCTVISFKYIWKIQRWPNVINHPIHWRWKGLLLSPSIYSSRIRDI